MNQDLVDFCNGRITFYQSEIAIYEAQKLSFDDAVAQAEASIDSLNSSKDQADQSIANFNDYIAKMQELLDLLSEQNA